VGERAQPTWQTKAEELVTSVERLLVYRERIVKALAKEVDKHDAEARVRQLDHLVAVLHYEFWGKQEPDKESGRKVVQVLGAGLGAMVLALSVAADSAEVYQAARDAKAKADEFDRCLYIEIEVDAGVNVATNPAPAAGRAKAGNGSPRAGQHSKNSSGGGDASTNSSASQRGGRIRELARTGRRFGALAAGVVTGARRRDNNSSYSDRDYW
jgi:hypothetical protein